MDKNKNKAILESILFTMGESVDIERLAGVLELSEKTVEKYLDELKKEMDEDPSRGVTIMKLEGAYQMCSKSEMYEWLIKIASSPRKYTLTDSLLETLSIIAYKQPITKIEIEKIRGVNCDHAISRLMEFDLVCELGRMEAPGRPMLFGTTEQFLRSFNVTSLDDLPHMNTDRMEEFRAQAEKEVQLKLDI
ncbi:MAG TPA: SMC-Scp complex subunit ScpB [Lachnospiraceae bacterium]|nr:SMC-Scp complex subunit ScpB [Lachnospiraceae bacterium]